MVVVLNYDKAGNRVVRLARANGRILCRWNSFREQWRIEPKAARDGFTGEAYVAAQCAAYLQGLTDFSPAVHSPELGITVRNMWD